MTVPAQFEIAGLASKVGAVIFKTVAIGASALLAGIWYFRQFHEDPTTFHLYYTIFVTAGTLLTLFVVQAHKFGTKGTIVNVAANLFSITYLGFFISFVLAIRIESGLWAMLMFVAVVKGSDIGAYTLGKMIGKHKFSPVISPGKTWEGLAGAGQPRLSLPDDRCRRRHGKRALPGPAGLHGHRPADPRRRRGHGPGAGRDRLFGALYRQFPGRGDPASGLSRA